MTPRLQTRLFSPLSKSPLLNGGLSLGFWLASLWGGEKEVEFPAFLCNSLNFNATRPEGVSGSTQPYKIQITSHETIIEVPAMPC
jgi:hypothetical protein